MAVDMNAHRKQRLARLMAGPPYLNDRPKFTKASGLTKGRITQLLDPDVVWGELSARRLAVKLGLDAHYFDQGIAGSPAQWPFATITPEEFYSLNEDVRQAAEAGLHSVLQRSGESGAATAKRKAPKRAST